MGKVPSSGRAPAWRSTSIALSGPPESPPLPPTTVIDIGSNAGRAVVIQPRPGGHLEVVEEFRSELQLGAALNSEGELSVEGRLRTIAAIEDFLALSRAAGAGHVLAVGTSAMRRATNIGQLLDEVRDRFGLVINVIDGPMEGHYSFLGAAHGLPVSDGMVIDIGGGSVELAHFSERQSRASWSFPWGSLPATDHHLDGDPPSPASVDRLRDVVRDSLKQSKLPQMPVDTPMIGTGGAVRNLAKIDRRRQPRSYPIARLHGYELPAERISRLVARLLALPSGDRASIPGLNPSRGKSIMAGAIVLDTVMAELGARRLLVSGQGLREGVLRGSLGRVLPPGDLVSMLPSPRAVRRASVRALVARFAGWHEQRSRRTLWTAVELLDRAHRPVDSELRELMDYAAMVVECGAAIDFYNREDLAAEIVVRTDLAGFSHRTTARLAALIHLLEGPRFEARTFSPLLTRRDQPALELAASALALAANVHRRVPATDASLVRARADLDEITLEVPAGAGRLTPQVIIRARHAFGRPVRLLEVRPPSGD